MRKYSDQEIRAFGLDPEKVPAHVAIIMDGNGRWAKKRGLPRTLGHRQGVETLDSIIRFSSDIGIRVLTLYAFSTENWKRPQEEVGVLMNLIVEYFNKKIDELDANQVRIRAIGDISRFPDRSRTAIENAIERTSRNPGLILQLALNYGSRAEILRAANLSMQQAEAAGESGISEERFVSNLYTAGVPDVDLMIRTSGEQRLSNFLLWQMSYAEMIFTDILWPDFSREEYIRCLKVFSGRSRRYGGLEDEKK